MRSGSPLHDGVGDGAQPIATDGDADGRAVVVGDDDVTIEADGTTEADGGDDGRASGWGEAPRGSMARAKARA